jgi:predicted DsbA family dithiol-disulfide isomerase
MKGFNFRSLFRRDSVDFYGDFIDPFGYIGFHNLRQAAEEAGTSIRWKGFELHPDTRPEGERFQTAENSDLRAGMWASVRSYGQKAGLDLVDPGFAPQSRLAHQLVLAWPGSPSTKNPLIERIYQAYLSERKNIGEASVLVEIAGCFGISQNVCCGVLRNGPSAQMARHRAEATRFRFPGMPAYRFRNQTSFGAVSTEEWRRIFKT